MNQNRANNGAIGSIAAPFNALALTFLISLPAIAKDEQQLDFQRDIRPILSDACFECHGPDAATREADLRLDTQGGASADLGGYQAIVPGQPDVSEALRRITTDDEDLKMPPADSGKSLKQAQIDLLRQWVKQGATYSVHWSFAAPQRPPVPEVGNPSWVRNSIDAFVLAHLERQGLRPSPQAGPARLVRRVHLDLTGIIPSLPELDEFMATDADERGYASYINRLLESPHYGERWARVWLDAARYADSDGYEKDKSRQVWFYRDWVINALNRDLPYDQFVVDQIAGDLLPNPTQDQIVATGFLRNSMINEEGGIDPEQFRMAAMFDRMDAVGTAILGLTIQCGQCHSHKYDPLTQEEYYRLFAFINDSHEASVSVFTTEEQQLRQRIFAEIARIEDHLKTSDPDWLANMATWEASLNVNQPDWQVLDLTFDDGSLGGQKLLSQSDGSMLAQGYAPTKSRPKLMANTSLRGITGFRLELLTDPNLPRGGPGRSLLGTAALTEFEVHAASLNAPEQAKKVPIASATSNLNAPQKELDKIFNDKSDERRVTGPIAFALDGDGLTAWGTDAGPGRRNQPREAVFAAETAINDEEGVALTFYLTQNHGGWNSDDNQTHNLGRFRLSVTNTPAPKADPLPARVREALSTAPAKRTASDVATIFGYWRTTVPAWRASNEEIERLWSQHPEGHSQLVLQARDEPRTTHMLERGDFLKPSRPVSPGVPAFLHAMRDDATEAPRLKFARWLVDRQSPTTARAIVNRIWQTYFGRGLVITPEDLGSQGEQPSHPELLDWLSVELMESGWSLKHVHRLIVTSATYRQSSHVSSQLLERDPYNRLLARGARYRVDGEIVRDIMLTASGLLTASVGGPSVYPPAPEFLFVPPTSYGPKVWETATGPDRYRRALYTFRFRSVPYPMLQTFDAPNGDAACVRRDRSNTPLQALTSLNEPLSVECARALALRIVRHESGDDHERLEYATRLCLARLPSAKEAQILLEFLHSQQEKWADSELGAWQLAAEDPEHPPRLPVGCSPADLAAWASVSRVLLNLDETITRQ